MSDRCGVVVAHGRLAEGLLSALERVVGPQDSLWAVSNDDLGAAELTAAVEEIVRERSAGREAVLFSDLDGGSCGQACRRLFDGEVVRAVFFGTNLPLLVEFVFLQGRPFDEFADAMVEKGRRAIGLRR